jgi:hypothetical protein
MKRLSFLFLLIAIVLMSSCEKNSFRTTERTFPAADAALVKVAFLSATNTAFNVILYLDDVRMSYPLGFNTPFPGGGIGGTGGSNNSDFMVVKAGDTKVSLKIPVSGTDVPASTYFETTQNFLSGKRQTLFISDTGANTAAWNVIVDTQAPDSGFARVHFVNAIPNAPTVDFYKGASAATATVIASDVKYKSASEYVDVVYGIDSFFVRTAGAPTSTPLVRVRLTTGNQRVYSIYGRGYIGSTGTRIPGIYAIINQ